MGNDPVTSLYIQYVTNEALEDIQEGVKVGGVLLPAIKGATTVLKLGGPSAERGGMWGGVSLLPTGEEVWGESRAPSPENFMIFLSENGEFWCILGGASALYVI